MLGRLVLILLLPCGVTTGPKGTDMNDVVLGNNAFAVDLYSRTKGEAGNLFFSPYSISTALAMTYTGAEGQTANEMAATLRFPADKSALETGFASLVASFGTAKAGQRYELDVANALWGQGGLEYNPDFLRRCESSYAGSLHPLDFAADPDAARRKINAWVEAKTHDKIKDLLGPNAVRRDTDLILTNAIYFKASWASSFSKQLTTSQDFAAATGPIQVPLMNRMGQYRYLDASADGLQVVEMPYAGNELSMVVLLPKAKDGLSSLETSLTASKLQGWIDKMGATRLVNLSLPRFKIEQTLDLAGLLKAMGMPLAFTPQADFSGITTIRRLFLSAVVHKAFIDVNEEGTEAAGATGVIMSRTAAIRQPEEPVVFRVDHPFLFLIRDVRTGSILFLGRVVKP